MTNVLARRMTAKVDGEFIVFLIGTHRPAWAVFNSAVASSGDVGIWHETYRVRPGDFECVYNNMPTFGLAQATRAVPATGHRESAAGRMASRAPISA